MLCLRFQSLFYYELSLILTHFALAGTGIDLSPVSLKVLQPTLILFCSELECFVAVSCFHPSLMFVGKAGAYPSGAP